MFATQLHPRKRTCRARVVMSQKSQSRSSRAHGAVAHCQRTGTIKNIGQILQPFDLHLPRQIQTKNINVLLVFLPQWRTVLLVRPTLFSVKQVLGAHDWYKKSLEAACCIPAVVGKWPICPATANEDISGSILLQEIKFKVCSLVHEPPCLIGEL